MARSTSESIRARLVVASDKLRPTDPLLADALDEVLAPRGWELLKLKPATRSGGNPNLAIPMPRDVREQLKALASESLTADVNEAFTAFLAGKFVPDAPVRARRNSGATAETVNLNVTPDRDLMQQVKDIAPERTQEYGWTVTPARVAAAYLLQKHNITTAKA
ncbi:hypothetical protein XF35_40030 [Streptomyces platensis subsp. clarensis]|uniref:Uncharacterized protein n=1 Tax=Streptomyces showdoensis TaxID=68268 RepID=A0A2P2GKP1_STREW|nr:hypothetical protein [Streptomyces showdoensis]KKZ72084.1 hypothetical protein VO63_20090 [Streptomyces showdoensis]MCW7991233.1 hypothetical protein [Streptomyces platensis subsp. clarensis]